jgi:3-oxoadipate enol-lactonase
VVGSGPPLVQIHGIGTGHHNFDLLTPFLADRFHVIDVDLPGYGASDPLGSERTIDGLATAVTEFLVALDLPPAHVHGTSFGGLVAMTVAARDPALVERLVVTCSFARLDRAMRAMQRSWASAAGYGGEILAEVTSVQGFSRGFWDRPDADEVQSAFVAAMSSSSTADFLRDLPLMADIDLSSLVRRISVPTLLLGADEDQITPVKTAPSGLGMSDLAELIPTATLHVLRECGHFISIEQASNTAEVMIDFLTKDGSA